MKVGIIGFSAAGKRTLFTLLTGRKVPEGRRPEESLDGAARIADARVSRLAELCQPEKTVYAENLFTLCPDIVPGEQKRPWLESAKRCDLLCPVIRVFSSEQVYHPEGSVDAERDRRVIASELLLADMELVDTRLTRIEKEKRSGTTPERELEEKVLRKCMVCLESEKPLRELGLEAHELAPLRSLGLITLRPQLWLYNVDDSDLGRACQGGLAVSCLIEAEIMGMASEGERREFLESLGLKQPGVDRVNGAVYDALGLMSFYTSGKDEVRAWTIRKGSPAPVAGGKIHSDIERGFIRVEVVSYDDFVATGSEKAAREQGKMHLKGKDYIMEDGMICHFLFNV